MKIKKHILFVSIFLFYSLELYSQNFISPLNIPPLLSANFGDLRNNHFHSGLDFKTQTVVNKPVFAVADGYISRINISSGGYGLALYIDHPNGYTTVYGHLNSFSKKIADYAKQKQYENESFAIDIQLPPNEIPVKRGEQIALSGNTGGSGGPHLHFEVRDTKTEEPIDGMNFIGKILTDTQAPEIRGIAFYPIQGKSVINNGSIPIYTRIPEKSKTKKIITAWGKIGVGVKAFDRMNGTTNTYGVKYIRLFVDGRKIFSSTINQFSFDKTRMINSFIDFEEWRRNKSFYMKSFVEQGNALTVYDNINNGYININEERNYQLRYELEDHYGNKTTHSFSIKGQKTTVPTQTNCENYMSPVVNNGFYSADFTLNIPIGNLYTDICYTHNKIQSQKYYSDIHQVNNKPIPLNKNGKIWIKLKKDIGGNISQMGIISIDKNGKEEWKGGTYKDGGFETSINELGGRYAIDIDTINPIVAPQSSSLWIQKKRIIIQVTDDKSGITFYRGEIDGKYALFTHDVKSKLYFYEFDDERLMKGQKHTLSFTAMDAAGNQSVYKNEFLY
ncbi:conserved hypothetical protein [uncultured Paludibacter sp.]|nr:conserved hypothetical protein [uncultured Paludibacter sp.]